MELGCIQALFKKHSDRLCFFHLLRKFQKRGDCVEQKQDQKHALLTGVVALRAFTPSQRSSASLQQIKSQIKGMNDPRLRLGPPRAKPRALPLLTRSRPRGVGGSGEKQPRTS